MHRIGSGSTHGFCMKKLKYKHMVLGILPCDLQELREIATYLFGAPYGSWSIEDDGKLMTIMSFAKPRDKETFVRVFAALAGADDKG